MNFFDFFSNKSHVAIILCIIVIVAFYFSSDGNIGMRQLLEPLENNSVTYYGNDGGHATVSTDSSGNVTVTVVDSSGNKTIYTKGSSNTVYVGQNGGTAEIITDNNGKRTVVVTQPDGQKVVYYNGNVNYDYGNTNYDNYNHYSGDFENVTFYGPNGGTAQVVKTPDENTIVITYKNGITDIYYIDGDATTYTGPNGNTAKVITDNNGKKSIEITMSDGSKMIYHSVNIYTPDTTNVTTDGYESNTYVGQYGNTATTYTGPNGNTATTVNKDYYNSLPEGIYKWQIPPGEEDKYILKSQVVPPVCPKCPDVQCNNNNSFDEAKCPPCPACARCPEPSFTCEKVPNYSAFNPKTMPLPVLSDFSSFGM